MVEGFLLPDTVLISRPDFKTIEKKRKKTKRFSTINTPVDEDICVSAQSKQWENA